VRSQLAALSPDSAGAQRWEEKTGEGRVVDGPGADAADMVVVRRLVVADERLVVWKVAAGEELTAGGEHEGTRPREGDARAITFVCKDARFS
jgi:hypothetical protein